MSRRSLLLLILATYASAVEVVTFTADEQASGTNSHLLIGSTSAILIDAPMTRSEASRWEAGIRTALAGRTLAIILVTDSHPDHTGSLPFMQQAFPSARLLAQPAVIADLRRDGPVYHGRLRSRLGEEMAATIAMPEPLAVDHLLLDGEVLPLIPFAGGHSANLTTILLPGGRLISSELVYQGHHLFLREQRIAGWRANLDQLTALAAKRGITILIPSHGQPCGLDELERMRAYFTALEDAVASGDRAVAAARMQAAFPAYRMPRFLTDYTLPAYLP